MNIIWPVLCYSLRFFCVFSNYFPLTCTLSCMLSAKSCRIPSSPSSSAVGVVDASSHTFLCFQDNTQIRQHQIKQENRSYCMGLRKYKKSWKKSWQKQKGSMTCHLLCKVCDEWMHLAHYNVVCNTKFHCNSLQCLALYTYPTQDSLWKAKEEKNVLILHNYFTLVFFSPSSWVRL